MKKIMIVLLILLTHGQVYASTYQTVKVLIGDKDDFHPGDTLDIPTQSQLVHELIASRTPEDKDVPLDVGGVNRPVGLTFYSGIPQNAQLVDAQVEFSFKGSELLGTDEILYEAPSCPSIRLLDILGYSPNTETIYTANIDLSNVPVRTCNGNFENRNLLPDLSDGQFDMMFVDDMTIDYAELILTYAFPEEQSGKIVVNNDEWTLSDRGFYETPEDAKQFALNVASYFTGSNPGNFLVYSKKFGATNGLVGDDLKGTMEAAGHAWTIIDTDTDFTLSDFLQYDGIFLSGTPADGMGLTPPNPQLLIEYVQAGGNIYLAGGTSIATAQIEADQWNPLLNACGLEFESPLNNINGVIPIDSNHPLFHGVQELFQLAGHSINKIDPANPRADVLIEYAGEGLYATCQLIPKTVNEVPVKTTGIIKTYNWKSGKDQALFKLKGVKDIGATARDAEENETPLTFQFGSADKPIYNFTATDDDVFNVRNNHMIFRNSSRDVSVSCHFKGEKCSVTIKRGNFDGAALDALLTGNMKVSLGVGDTQYTNTGKWKQYNSRNGRLTKYKKN